MTEKAVNLIQQFKFNYIIGRCQRERPQSRSTAPVPAPTTLTDPEITQSNKNLHNVSNNLSGNFIRTPPPATMLISTCEKSTAMREKSQSSNMN